MYVVQVIQTYRLNIRWFIKLLLHCNGKEVRKKIFIRNNLEGW